MSYDEIRAWPSQTFDLASRVAARANTWAALIIAIFTAILAIFTARLWRSTQRLWMVTNRTLHHAEQRSRKELRAYVTVETARDHRVCRPQSLGRAEIPARDVSIYSTIALDADPARSDFAVETPRISPTVLQPGAKMEFVSCEGYPIPTEQLDRAEPLKLAGYLYVWGEVLYTDELHTTGWTSFCHRYSCDMFGASDDEMIAGRVRNRSIHPKFARYHEEAGNEAG